MLRELRIGDMVAKLPIIQGGMGVGVSLSRLAGAVAKEGGVGVISTAQIGFEEPEFEKDQAKANLIAIKKHIKKAKELACGHGMVGVNIMVALKHYKEHVLAAVEAGADVIISGAGLPMELPELVDEKSHTRIAPIVSSKRAANLILKMWAHRYNRTADFIVIEGPKAGGHLGFSNEQLADMEHMDYDSEIKEIISCTKTYEEKFKKHIPVIVAGGVFTHEDVMHCMELGADGVQVASRFVATEECDASDAYKHAYLNANESDVQIIQSPVGMPGRAVRNEFIRGLEKKKRLPETKKINIRAFDPFDIVKICKLILCKPKLTESLNLFCYLLHHFLCKMHIFISALECPCGLVIRKLMEYCLTHAEFIHISL